MSESVILSWFAKSAEPNPYQRYRRQLHNLTTEARRIAIELMQAGLEPGKAIRKARREQ